MNNGSSIVLILFLKYLRRCGIQYCVVGNTGSYSSFIEGDVDIVIPQQKIKIIHSLVLSFCKNEGIRLVQCLQHEHNAFYYVIQWFESGIPKFLKLDICGDFYWKALLFIKSDEIISRAMETVDGEGNGKHFFVPVPANEFIYYLLKKLDKGHISSVQAVHLHDQWKKDPEGCLGNIRRFWKKDDCDLISKAAESNDWNPVIVAIPTLKKSIHSNVRVTWKGLYGEFLRRIRRVVFPTGLTVAFLGSDGSGKSSVLQLVASSLAPVFRKQAYYHLRPFLLRARAAGDVGFVTNPHASTMYGLVLSVIKLIYLCLDYTIGHFTIIRWRKIFSTFVLFDRYFQDIVVDPRRFRYGGPLWLARAFGKMLPSPDAFVFLNAPVDIVQKRKREVTYDECLRENNDYLKLASTLKKAIIIDASKPLKDVVAEVNGFLLNLLAQRAEKRLFGLSKRVVLIK